MNERMKGFAFGIALLLFFVHGAHSYSMNNSKHGVSRRSVFAVPFVIVGVVVPVASSSKSNALDMDAFMNRELALDTDGVAKTTPKLSDDEALCTFGAPSKEVGEACVRAGMSTKRPTGVDAFGKVDRGDYVRCKAVWVDPGPNEKLTKEWQCQ
jgi:hypothetical protein